MQNESLNLLDIVKYKTGVESAATRIQPHELESVVGWSQMSLVSSSQSSSQPVGQSQPQLVSSRWNSSQPQDRISRSSHPASGT